mmetsp:Transcript_6294/g.8192  ORF Transcript_6294/g.8192 Transcript_6294/m.8192 type:complete len:216 (+) Transcript_6294:109-756(+)
MINTRLFVSFAMLAATCHGFSPPPSPTFRPAKTHAHQAEVGITMGDLAHQAQKTIATSMAAACLIFLASSPAWAADFAGKDISGVDYSGQDLSGKDFTGVIAKNTNFHNCNLQDSKFSKANLVKADLSGADVRGANFVGATLDESNFKDVQGQKAIFSNTILDIGVLENIDLTSAIWPSKLRIMICDMDELKGTNPVTGVESRDTCFCTDYTRFS